VILQPFPRTHPAGGRSQSERIHGQRDAATGPASSAFSTEPDFHLRRRRSNSPGTAGDADLALLQKLNVRGLVLVVVLGGVWLASGGSVTGVTAGSASAQAAISAARYRLPRTGQPALDKPGGFSPAPPATLHTGNRGSYPVLHAQTMIAELFRAYRGCRSARVGGAERGVWVSEGCFCGAA
jgi:hypothetical protein